MKTLLLALAFAAGVAHAASAAAVGRLVDLTVYDRTSQRTLPVYRKRPPTAPLLITINPLHYAPGKTGAKRWASNTGSQRYPRGGW